MPLVTHPPKKVEFSENIYEQPWKGFDAPADYNESLSPSKFPFAAFSASSKTNDLSDSTSLVPDTCSNVYC